MPTSTIDRILSLIDACLSDTDPTSDPTSESGTSAAEVEWMRTVAEADEAPAAYLDADDLHYDRSWF